MLPVPRALPAVSTKLFATFLACTSKTRLRWLQLSVYESKFHSCVRQLRLLADTYSKWVQDVTNRGFVAHCASSGIVTQPLPIGDEDAATSGMVVYQLPS